MKNQLFILIFLLHFGVSSAGFLGLSAWALAVQDAGPIAPSTADPGPEPAVAPPAESTTALITWLEILLGFGLLQPIAYWVLASNAIAWWTWPGLVGLSALIALNSLVVAGIAAGCWRQFGATTGRQPGV